MLYTESILKKLTKKELIEIILKIQEMYPAIPMKKAADDNYNKKTPEVEVASDRQQKFIEELDKLVPKSGGWVEGAVPEPRAKRPGRTNYTCSKCRVNFSTKGPIFTSDSTVLCIDCIPRGN